MTTIKDYIARLQDEEGMNVSDVARELGISSPMVSSYKTQDYLPSISVAKRVWKNYEIALHPFNGESLDFEVKKDESFKTPPLPGLE